MDLNSLKDQEELIVADSVKVINKILDHGKYKPLDLYVREDLKEFFDLSLFKNTFFLSEEEFRKVRGQNFHKGSVATFEKRETLTLKELKPPFVILNGVTSPENVGSIVRTISGLGFKSLIIDSKSCSPLLRRPIRVSMGNFVYLNIIRVNDIKAALKEINYPVYGTANHDPHIDWTEWKPEKESGFIIGSEGHGMDAELYPLCKGIVKIPIDEKVQHFNASVSCAIVGAKYLLNSI